MLTIVSFVVLLLVLIFVHEMGHFLAAKLMGVKVERFSLGFPPKAWSKVIGETEYQLAWLPLGGYVKMYGEDPTSEEKVPPEMEKRSFSHQPVWSKMIIVVAGSLFNLIFAALLFWGLIWLGGIPHLTPIIGPVASDSPAAKAGIQMDDVLVSVNGQEVIYFDALNTALQEGQGAPVEVGIKRPGQPLQTHLLSPTRVDTKDILGDPLTYWEVGISHRTLPIIENVVEDMPAQRAGLEIGDRIISVNGQPTLDWVDVVEAIKGPLEKRDPTTPPQVMPLKFEVERQGGPPVAMTVMVTPELGTTTNTFGDIIFTNPVVGIKVKTDVLTESIGIFLDVPHLAPIVGPVASDSPAARAGIQMDDVLVSVNGQEVIYFDDLVTALQEGQGAPLEVVVKRAGQPLQTHLLSPTRVDTKDLLGNPLTYWEVGISHRTLPIIENVVEGKPAQKMGLKAGDRIVSINGQPTPDWVDAVEIVKGPVEKRYHTTPPQVMPLKFEVERQGKQLVMMELTPELTTALNVSGETTFSPIVGIEVKNDVLMESVGIFQAAYMGGAEALRMIELTLLSVKKLVTGQVSVKAMGGPILIAEVTGDRAEAGLIALLSLAAFISINLGILNLLPIPVLDGGQLVFFFIEAIRRKPLSLRIREMAQWVGMAMLGLLMIVVFYNDISRVVTRFTAISGVENQETELPTPSPVSSKDGGSSEGVIHSESVVNTGDDANPEGDANSEGVANTGDDAISSTPQEPEAGEVP